MTVIFQCFHLYVWKHLYVRACARVFVCERHVAEWQCRSRNWGRGFVFSKCRWSLSRLEAFAESHRASRGGDENVERWPDLPVNNHYIHCNTWAAIFFFFFGSSCVWAGNSLCKRGLQASPSGESSIGQAREFCFGAFWFGRVRLLGALQDFLGGEGLCPRRRHRPGSSRGLVSLTSGL